VIRFAFALVGAVRLAPSHTISEYVRATAVVGRSSYAPVVRMEGSQPQEVGNPICARICARDAAGQTEMGET